MRRLHTIRGTGRFFRAENSLREILHSGHRHARSVRCPSQMTQFLSRYKRVEAILKDTGHEAVFVRAPVLQFLAVIANSRNGVFLLYCTRLFHLQLSLLILTDAEHPTYVTQSGKHAFLPERCLLPVHDEPTVHRIYAPDS
jgi:hypothetical protein